MIKAMGTRNGRPILMLGLSHGNLKKFLSDPDTYIPIKAEEINIPFDIVIFAGETEKKMYEALKGSFTSHTTIHGVEE